MTNTNIVFEHELKSRGLRFTTQRKAVLDIIVKNQGKHLSPEEIYDLVKINTPEIGVATVYRTLMILENMGLVLSPKEEYFIEHILKNKRIKIY
jgi:Fur family ferric uptake transcriptional regulator